MARYKKDQGQPLEFLRDLYETMPDGFIELRLKENGAKGKMLRRSFAGNVHKAAKFVDAYADRRDKTAIYFGVGKRKEQTDGTKANVLGVTALWADVDCDKQGWDTKATVEALYRLPGILQPSALVFSGGGLHAYWFLKDPVLFDGLSEKARREAIEDVEDANRSMQRLVSSDRVHDVSRVLRCPGSFNTKGSPKGVECVFRFRWHKGLLSGLADAADDYGKVLGPDGFVHPSKLPKPKNAKVDMMTAYEMAFNFDKKGRQRQYKDLWELCRMGATPPYIGLDEAVLRATALLHMDGVPEATIVNEVMRDATAIKQRDEGMSDWRWSEDKQREFITDKLRRFEPKFKAYKARQSALKRAQKKAEKGKAGDAADQNNRRG